MSKKKPMFPILCKIPGCLEFASSKGMCSRHHSQFVRGIIDEVGKQLRKPFAQEPLNYALQKTLRLVRRASKNEDDIRKDIKAGNKPLKHPLNRRLLDINKETAGQEARLLEKDFIFGNLHLLQARTLQLVLESCPPPVPGKMTVHDKVRIAWHLSHGVKSQKLTEMLPKYTLSQVQQVVKELKNGTLPSPPDALRSNRILKATRDRRHRWQKDRT